MEYVVGIVSSLIIATLTFVVQTLMRDNKRLRLNRREENEQRELAMKEGVTSLLRVQLIEYHEKYAPKGNIPNYAYENWEKMYNAYRGLGGNGMLIQMNEDIKELEFKK